VYRAGAPARGAAPASLGVSGAWRRTFGTASDSARDPALRVYLADMLRPFGLTLAEDRLTEGQSYGEMAGALLAEEVAAQDPVDLLVFAFAVPDVAPWRATASYLSHLCPGRPFAFAVCDQGVTAPFTALRLIREYAATGGCRRALLVVAEQAVMPYRQAGLAASPDRHAVVALLCEQYGHSVPGPLDTVRPDTVPPDTVPPDTVPPDTVRLETVRLETVRLHASVTRQQACRLLACAAADLPTGDELTAIVGTGLADDALDAGLPARVVIAPPEQPTTGVWWEVAAGLPEWTARADRADRADRGSAPGAPGARSARSARVLLADYDPGLGHLGLAVVEISGERQ
jgi:hypothetical protein